MDESRAPPLITTRPPVRRENVRPLPCLIAGKRNECRPADNGDEEKLPAFLAGCMRENVGLVSLGCFGRKGCPVLAFDAEFGDGCRLGGKWRVFVVGGANVGLAF